MAQCGDIDADEFAGFQQCSTLRNFHYVVIYSKFYQFLFHDENYRVSLENFNSIEVATRLAHTAADALEWINNMRFAHIAHDSVSRTVASASATAFTLLGVNGVGQESLALLSAASVLLNVLYIFIIEIVDS